MEKYIQENYNISPAQMRVLRLIKLGMSNKEIADRLCLTIKTVKYHLTTIYKKCRVKSRAQLIILLYNI